jgi:hypothetical protein
VPAGADTWDAPITSATPTFEYVVEVAGTYAYKCTPHFSMGMAGGFTASTTADVAPVLASTDFSVGVDYIGHRVHVKIDNLYNSHSSLKLIDITGREIATVFDGVMGTGEQVIHYDVADRTAGIYFLRLEQNGKVVTHKVMIN